MQPLNRMQLFTLFLIQYYDCLIECRIPIAIVFVTCSLNLLIYKYIHMKNQSILKIIPLTWLWGIVQANIESMLILDIKITIIMTIGITISSSQKNNSISIAIVLSYCWHLCYNIISYNTNWCQYSCWVTSWSATLTKL